MKLIFIHGAPAVGKLTVAQEIAKKNNFKVLHNHLTLDLVSSLFESNTKPFWEEVQKIRLQLIKKAAKENIKGLIITYSDITGNNFSFLKKVIKVVESYKGKVELVHLFAEEKELLKRVKGVSRKKYLKTTCSKKLKKSLKTWDFATTYPKKKTLSIDTSKSTAKKTAEKIIKELKLSN